MNWAAKIVNNSTRQVKNALQNLQQLPALHSPTSTLGRQIALIDRRT
jgi:hypothetical protein